MMSSHTHYITDTVTTESQTSDDDIMCSIRNAIRD